MHVFQILLAAASLVASACASAQAFPVKPVVIVEPFAAGGGQDLFARALAKELAQIWGQPVLVENRVGATGIIGTEHVARAPGDGYTLLLSDAGSVMVTPLLYKGKLKYDPERDLVAVSGLITNASSLLIGAKLPANNVKEFLELAKAKPGQLSYGSFGIGSTAHLITLMFERAAGIQSMNHVPYKGLAPALTDVAGGHVDVLFSPVGSAMPYVKTGKMKMLAVVSLKRQKLVPDVPTLGEAGIKDVAVEGFWGIHASRGTPRAVVDKINGDIQRILQQPAFVARNVEPLG